MAKLRIRLDRNLVCELPLNGTYVQSCMSIALSWFSKMATWRPYLKSDRAEIWERHRRCLCSHKVRTGPTQLNALQLRSADIMTSSVHTRYVILFCCVMKSRHDWDLVMAQTIVGPESPDHRPYLIIIDFQYEIINVARNVGRHIECPQRGTFNMSPSISGNIYIIHNRPILAENKEAHGTDQSLFNSKNPVGPQPKSNVNSLPS
jgi:hypothetical protein